jgi:hypothetical protein
MRNIFLISYTGGMFGEFLATQIANDPNYYPPAKADANTAVNRFNYIDVLSEKFKFLSDHYSLLNTEQIALITDLIKDKNICSLTHWPHPDNIKIPGLKKVKFFVDEKDAPIVFMFLIYKTQLSVKIGVNPVTTNCIKQNIHVLTNRTLNILNSMPGDRWLGPMDVFLLSNNLVNSTTAVDQGFDHMSKNASVGSTVETRESDILYLNPLDLLRDPETHMPEWKEKLNLINDFDFELLKQYNQKNEDIIKKILGSTTIGPDWKERFTDYLDPYLLVDQLKKNYGLNALHNYF